VSPNSAAVLHSKQILLLGTKELTPQKTMERNMFEVDDTLRSRRILTLFFAFLSGISAVSTAVMPAILHV
jgi:hypothetical protein